MPSVEGMPDLETLESVDQVSAELPVEGAEDAQVAELAKQLEGQLQAEMAKMESAVAA